MSIALHGLIALLFRFLLPESLSRESRAQLTKRAHLASERKRERVQAQVDWERAGPRRLAERDAAAAADSGVSVGDGNGSTGPPGDSGFSVRSGRSMRGLTTRHRTMRRSLGAGRRLLRRCVWFLEPLTVLLPQRRDDGSRDWNLTLTAAMLFLGSWIMGVMQIKFTYAFYAFGWTTAQYGPYLSFIALCRMSVLLGGMPLVMWLVRRRAARRAARAAAAAGPSETTPLLLAEQREPEHSPAHPKRSARLDLTMTRACLLIEVAGMLALGLNVRSSDVLFIVVSAFLTLGSPGGAACNSLALSFLTHQREAGALFGALSVLTALGSALLSPLIMANVFSATVAWYPPAIFLCAAGILAVALVISFGLRLDRPADVERDTRETARA